MAFASMAMATIWTAHGDNTPWNFKTAGPTYTTQLSLIDDGFTVGDKVNIAALGFDFDNLGIVTK